MARKRGAPYGNRNAAGRRSIGGRVAKIARRQAATISNRTSLLYKFASRRGTIRRMSVGGIRVL